MAQGACIQSLLHKEKERKGKKEKERRKQRKVAFEVVGKPGESFALWEKKNV
jgi:hypothetical protein